MKDFDLGLVGGKVFINQSFIEANVYVKGGKVAALTREELPADRVLKVKGLLVLPGFVDPHVHFSLKLGPHRSADDFFTGGMAAACGGVTTVGDFTEPCSTEEEMESEIKRRMAEASNAYVDYFLHLTIANPSISPHRLCEIALDHGITSIKLFTTYSSSNRRTNDWYLLQLLKEAHDHRLTVMIHAENDEIIEGNAREIMKKAGHLEVRDLPYVRETITEMEAVSKVALFARWTGSRVYIAHLSSGLTLDHLKTTFHDILNQYLFIESAPHYFWFDNTRLFSEEGYRYAVCPPLRSPDEVKRLRAHLKSGDIAAIGTDHCPFNLDEREPYKDAYELMPNGLPGVEVSFVLMHTLAKQLHMPLEKLVPLFTVNVVKLMGFSHRKGCISPGKDADLVVFDPQAEWTITQSRMHSANDYTPYEGTKVTGRIVHTVLRGNVIVEDGEPVEEEGLGEFVERGVVGRS